MTESSVRDPLALGLGSLAGGAGFGSACLSASQVVTAVVRDYATTSDPNDVGSKALTAGLILAIGVGGGYAWYRSSALDNVWYRGVIAVLAAVGALLVGFLGAPVYHLAHMVGLIVWTVLGIAIGIVATRWALQGGGRGEVPGGSGPATP